MQGTDPERGRKEEKIQEFRFSKQSKGLLSYPEAPLHSALVYSSYIFHRT
jgi:hypothetical protein